MQFYKSSEIAPYLVTQEGGGYAWIPSIMRFVDGQILIENATHSFLLGGMLVALRYYKKVMIL